MAKKKVKKKQVKKVPRKKAPPKAKSKKVKKGAKRVAKKVVKKAAPGKLVKKVNTKPRLAPKAKVAKASNPEKQENWIDLQSPEEVLDANPDETHTRDPLLYDFGYFGADSMHTGMLHFFKTERDMLEFICVFESTVGCDGDEDEFKIYRENFTKACNDNKWRISPELTENLSQMMNGEIRWLGSFRAELKKGRAGYFDWIFDLIDEEIEANASEDGGDPKEKGLEAYLDDLNKMPDWMKEIVRNAPDGHGY